MSNSYFQFKQFIIHHDRCAMKVGTDGVLLGAWAPLGTLSSQARLLDIGTGSGLITLMLAQRYPTAHITGIDIDSEAISQARDNISTSLFADRCDVLCSSLQDFTRQCLQREGDAGIFDGIVCNPPFFEERLLPPDVARRDARHTVNLSFEELVCASARLLRPGARFGVIIPTNVFERFRQLCFVQGLFLVAQCTVVTAPGKMSKRILACFQKGTGCADDILDVDVRTLTLTEDGHRSADYAALTREFYLF